MPQRVASRDVLDIIDTTVDPQPFIVAASLLVDRHLGNAGLDAALLTEIERYLAAHFVCLRDPRLVEGRAEGLAVRFQRGTAGAGLEATDYGRAVKYMDPTGILVGAMTGQRASFHVD